MDMGFNGARPHEKIFEERYFYHCDRHGYLVWGEYPNWGLDHSDPRSVFSILPEWLEEVERDRNHPSIIGWCPFNETWPVEHRPQINDVLRMVYLATKAVDPGRPCIDVSGGFHVMTDIYDVHDYDQNPETFKANYDRFMTEGFLYDWLKDKYGMQQYTGGPAFVSEYGGIRWAEGEKDETGVGSWGYGKDVEGLEDFKRRFKGLTDALLDNDKMLGLCYTQLTDVEQEQNGLYTYDRKAKFDPEWVKSVMSRKAAIED
jgi:beta-galactosidase/beta-glucuronidase